MVEPATFNFQLPSELRDLAEQSVEQARRTFDDIMGATRRAVSSFEDQSSAAQNSARQLQQTVARLAERNVAASFALAQRLLRAQSAQEAVQLYAEYLKEQIATLSEQARELTEHSAPGSAQGSSH